MSFSAAVLGLGKMGASFESVHPTSHSEAIDLSESFRLVAGVDTDQTKRVWFSERWKAPAYGSLSEMLAKHQIELVCVSTPANVHLKNLSELLKLPVPAIICEKPLAANLSEAERIWSVIQESSRICSVHHWMRLSKQWMDAKSLLPSLGRIERIRYTYSKGVFNSGTHAFDIIRFLFGEVAAVEATHAYAISTGELNIEGRLHLQSGLVVELDTKDFEEEFVTQCDIKGSHERLLLGDTYQYAGKTEQHCDDSLEALGRFLDEIAMALKNPGIPLSCTTFDGYQAVRIAESLVQSSACGNKRIELT